MFGKAKADGGELVTASQPRRGAPRAPSLIGPDLTIQGDVSGSGELHVDGRITGDVHVERLTVGETGVIEGAVEAQTVEVRGRLTGSVHAKLVRLAATAHVEADIAHEQMAVELGAHFQGRCLQVGGVIEPASQSELTAS